MKEIKSIITLIIPFLVLFSSCQGQAVSLEQEESPEAVFQKAQEAFDQRNYKVALACYQSFIDKFPDDKVYGIQAKYEIGFIHHKMGDEEKAVIIFDEILAEYLEEGSENLPQWVKILAEKVKTNIQDKEQL